MKQRLSREQVLEYLSYNPETGIFTRVKTDSHSPCFGREVGTVNSNGYVVIRIYSRLYYAHRLAWLVVTGAWPENLIDHINRNKADNRFSNLREADRSKNEQNKPISSRNTSGFRGIYWNSAANKWCAGIVANGIHHYLGVFADIQDAAAAYAEAAARLHDFMDEDVLRAAQNPTRMKARATA